MTARVHRSVSTWQQLSPTTASPARDALLADVAKRILALGDHRLRIAVDGRTSAGKTSFGHELAARIVRADRPVWRASLDDFKRPWRDRHRYDRESGEGYYRNAFDYPAVIRLLLEPAGADGSGSCALCGIDPLTQVDHSAVTTQLTADAALIVDGVFAYRPEIDRFWDFRIWLDIDAETAVRRGVERDHAREGDAAEALHRDRYGVAETVYLSEVDPYALADVVIDNSDFRRPYVRE